MKERDTVPNAAAYAGVAKTTMWGLVLTGTIASYKIGKCRRVARADVDTFLAKCRQEGGRQATVPLAVRG